MKNIEKNNQILNINELNTFISAHKSRLSIKGLIAFAKTNGIETDAMRKTNKAHLIKQL